MNIEGPAVIELIGPVVDPAVGPGMVLLRVTDAAGRPLDDVSLQLKGDMTHAGMVPVLAESSQGANGLYRLPFEWTMAGDWLLTVEAQLPAGEKMQARFPITVSGEDPGCEVDETPADRSELNASG